MRFLLLAYTTDWSAAFSLLAEWEFASCKEVGTSFKLKLAFDIEIFINYHFHIFLMLHICAHGILVRVISQKAMRRRNNSPTNKIEQDGGIEEKIDKFMSFWWKYYSLQASSSSIHILFDWRIYSVNYGGKWLSSMNPIHHSHAHIISLRWRICYIHCILEFPREITHVKYSIQISWMHETFPQKASRSRFRTNYYFTWFAHSLTVNYSRFCLSLSLGSMSCRMLAFLLIQKTNIF